MKKIIISKIINSINFTISSAVILNSCVQCLHLPPSELLSMFMFTLWLGLEVLFCCEVTVGPNKLFDAETSLGPSGTFGSNVSAGSSAESKVLLEIRSLVMVVCGVSIGFPLSSGKSQKALGSIKPRSVRFSSGRAWECSCRVVVGWMYDSLVKCRWHIPKFFSCSGVESAKKVCYCLVSFDWICLD